jgi:putative transcriptional regulator
MELRTDTGTLLAAAPALLDPNFMHAVVLMCQHTDEGAYGLVVNRRADVTVDALLPDHEVLGSAPFPVHIGGPVGRDTLQFVHRIPERIPGGVLLAAGLYLGGELDAMARVVAEDGPEATRYLRLVVGYSGWGRGQLDAELASGSWLPAPLVPDVAFGEDQQATWRRVVRSVGERGMEYLPPDPSWN